MNPDGQPLTGRHNLETNTMTSVSIESPIPAPIPPPPLPGQQVIIRPAPPPTIEDDRTFLASKLVIYEIFANIIFYENKVKLFRDVGTRISCESVKFNCNTGSCIEKWIIGYGLVATLFYFLFFFMSTSFN